MTLSQFIFVFLQKYPNSALVPIRPCGVVLPDHPAWIMTASLSAPVLSGMAQSSWKDG
jgi:hypothetical protein